MANNKRKPISQKVRFEVFKRDKFTCQYCGRKSPDVVLHVDHIKPVAEGGTNDILNLVTACADCNFGKGKRELSDDAALVKQQKQVELLAERKEQLEMYAQWRDELANKKVLELNFILSYIKKKLKINNDDLMSEICNIVEKHLKKTSAEVIIDAVNYYNEKHHDGKYFYYDKFEHSIKIAKNPGTCAFNYFKKILMNKAGLKYSKFKKWDNDKDEILEFLEFTEPLEFACDNYIKSIADFEKAKNDVWGMTSFYQFRKYFNLDEISRGFE